ncbi:MAG TPA: Gfo/Idh/MocA family oxidoreductase, partial [Gemmataceae bacterium]
RARGANERVRLGLIGCGGRGRFVAGHARKVPGAELVAVCDVYEKNLAAARAWAGPHCEGFRDFRRLLERKDIDAVIVATPDHWHAIPTVLACQAGKDVYVEKPLGHNVREGRAMVAAARKYERVVQTGTQQHSAPHFEAMRRIIQGGELGRVHYVRIWNFRNSYPRGMGRQPDSAPPEGLDWDFYLGPAPKVPFNRNRFLGNFRWFWDYAGGIVTDWGTHRFESMHHVTGAEAPKTVAAAGGRFALDDGGETPDVLQVTYEYPGFVVSYEACALNAHGAGGRTPGRAYYRAVGADDRPNGMAFYGTSGALFADRLGFEVYPELKPGVSPRGRDPKALPPEAFRTQRKEGSSPDSTFLHVSDFIDCVRTRKRPVADVAIGHRASTVAHLGNIAYRTGRKLTWDAAKEEIVGDPEAAALLGRAARKPWDLI